MPNNTEETINDIISIALDRDASDIHLTSDRHPIIRISNVLHILDEQPVQTADSVRQILQEILSEDEMNRFTRERSLDFSFSYSDKIRFRCNAYYQKGTPALAMRLIPPEVKTLEELNLPDNLRQFTKKEQGFFLVVGPVGQGKTTTLSAMIDLINHQRAEHIITIEDPIEYMYEDDRSIIDQREVRIDTPDFDSALNSVFRQDVDVVMIGEMRGQETMSTAVTAGETGHLVFSTLHTNDAAQTIDRIIDTFPANQQEQIRAQLASSLSGIFSQRLIPRIDGGRIPAFELLINNTAVSNLIREGRTHEIDSVIETSADAGMISMNQSLVQLIRDEEITLEEARRWTLKPRQLERMI
jgi:twitching motility protein PilT